MKPIIFSGSSIQAILDGRKTQTRRVVMPANPFNRHAERNGGYKQGDGLWIDGYSALDTPTNSVKDYSISSYWMDKDYYIKTYAPYKPGDVLWVRETWRTTDYEYIDGQWSASVQFKADMACGERLFWNDGDSNSYGCTGWRPSIHMPRAAARLFLRVADVRVERLHDISGEDCIREGVEQEAMEVGAEFTRGLFSAIWDEINAKRGYPWEANPWEANPWVWVYTFERIEKPEEDV